MVVFRWHYKFKDGFTILKGGSRPGQPKNVVTNANIAAVTGLIKGDARLTVKNIAHSVCISSGSAHKMLTQQLKLRTVCARCTPSLDQRTKVYLHVNAQYLSKKCQHFDKTNTIKAACS